MYGTFVRKGNTWQKVMLVTIGLVLSIVSVVVPLSQFASAEAGVASVSAYTDDTIRRSLAEAMTECVDTSAYDTGNIKTAENIANGAWGNSSTAPFVGPLADNDRDGKLNCNEEIPRKLKEYFNYSSFTEMYCDLGGITPYGSTNCKDAQSNSIMRIPRTQKDSVISTLEKKLGKKLPRNSEVLDYALAFGSLTAKGYGCNAELRTNLSADDLKRSDNHKITVAMTDGTTKEVYYYVPQARQNDDIQMFAHGFNRWAGKSKLKCSDLINWASKNAATYAAQIKNDIVSETEGKIRTALLAMCTSGATGGTVTEYCNTQVSRWLSVCKGQIPTSGAVTDSPGLIQCLVRTSERDEDKIRAALANISVTEPTAEPADGDAVGCAISGVGWIVCPSVNFLAGVADMAFNFLADNFLSVPAGFFDPSGTTYKAWQTFVSIANAAFVIVFLVMIYSQITGGGWSNYALKKLLPRLIIAAVLVNLSFVISALAADLSNILGYSLKIFLSDTASTTVSGGTLGGYTDWDTGEGFAGIAGTVLAGGVAVAGGVAASGGITLALVALLGILIPGVIALIMIFLILMVRQVLIVLLIVVAPLAFVAFLLPNTESLFKKWRKMFASMLLLFPIIGLIYGASSLASGIITSIYANSSNDAMVGRIIGAGVMILPLFVVPGVLKKSIDAIGSLGGKISGIGAKLSGGARNKITDSNFAKFQKQQSSQRKALTQAGKYTGRNPFRKIVSGLNSKKNNSETFNRLTGDYGYRSSAQGQAIFDKEEQEAAARALEYQYGGSAVDALKSSNNQAVKNLAVSTLASKGDWGAKQISQYLQSGGTISSRSMADTISGIKNTHAGLGEAGATAIIHFESGKTSGFSVSTADMANFSARGVAKLSDENLAKQSAEAIKFGASVIGAERAAEMLGNEHIRSSMTSEAKEIFNKISSKEVGAPAPPTESESSSSSRRDEAQKRLDEAAQGTSGSEPYVVSSKGTVADSAAQATGYDKQQEAANGTSSDPGRVFEAGPEEIQIRDKQNP